MEMLFEERKKYEELENALKSYDPSFFSFWIAL